MNRGDADPDKTTWSVHASAVVVGEAGVLIRGRSGSGKSSVALALLDPPDGGRLVGDDRIRLSVRHGRLIAQGHPQIAGLIERRGEGLLPVSFEPAAVVRCVVDLIGEPERDNLPRLPAERDLVAKLGTLVLPRLALLQSLPPTEAARQIRGFVHRLSH